MRSAVYPGSFDPVTRGHLDLVARACRVFDKVVVAVSNNAAKRPTFSVDERLRMLEESLRGNAQVEVDTYSGLLVDYLKARKINTVIRGLRAGSDLDYEFQLAAMNSRLHPPAETVFLMPDEKFTYLSASIVREVARLGGDIEPFVTPPAARRLRAKFKARK